MININKLVSILAGVVMILSSVMLISLDSETALKFIIFILCISLLFSGIRELFFYFTMARRMVGGRSILYRSIIVTDIGIFTLSLTDVPMVYIMLYLAGIHFFSGGIEILSALETKKMQGESWKLQFLYGFLNVIVAVLCLIFIKSIGIAVTIYAFGLASSGVMRIVQACRRTSIVYIQ